MVLLALPTLLAAVLLAPWGCGGGSGGKLPLVLAATSDLEESGILREWVREFQSKSGLKVELSAVTDQEALSMARHGECDLVITHFPEQEERLEKSNYVEGRREIMHDDYVIVGPSSDPAGVGGAGKATDALRKVAEAKAPFLLRADGSGTSYREAALWEMSGVADYGDWLLKSEAGMGDALRQASQLGAYAISDRSNFQNLSGELNLRILLEGGEGLSNTYQVMEVSGLAYPDTDIQGGQKFIDYLLSGDARRFFKLGAWEPPSG